MGCNCGKNKLPKAPRQAKPYAAPPPAPVTTYKNASSDVVSARNPRLSIQPGETVDLNSVEINSYVVKMAIRNGELVPAEDPKVEAAPAAKTAAPKTAAPKTAPAKAKAAAAAAA